MLSIDSGFAQLLFKIETSEEAAESITCDKAF